MFIIVAALAGQVCKGISTTVSLTILKTNEVRPEITMVKLLSSNNISCLLYAMQTRKIDCSTQGGATYK